MDGEIYARIGGDGRPLLLLHGYPQTHACWHRIAPRLAENCTVVVCDLPGYGASSLPRPLPGSAEFSKRSLAAALVAAMESLGFSSFFLAGHDRGARVAYRLALDHPQKVTALAVISILPTFAMWTRLQDNHYAIKAFRWFLLAQDAPFPEQLIMAAGKPYLHATLSDWTAAKSLEPFDARALMAYESAYSSEKTIAASCADYRAGWSVDRSDDQSDLEAARKIGCPTLVLWGNHEFPDPTEMERTWKRIANDVMLRPLDCGHFAPEEAPDEVGDALRYHYGL